MKQKMFIPLMREALLKECVEEVNERVYTKLGDFYDTNSKGELIHHHSIVEPIINRYPSIGLFVPSVRKITEDYQRDFDLKYGLQTLLPKDGQEMETNSLSQIYGSQPVSAVIAFNFPGRTWNGSENTFSIFSSFEDQFTAYAIFSDDLDKVTRIGKRAYGNNQFLKDSIDQIALGVNVESGMPLEEAILKTAKYYGEHIFMRNISG